MASKASIEARTALLNDARSTVSRLASRAVTLGCTLGAAVRPPPMIVNGPASVESMMTPAAFRKRTTMTALQLVVAPLHGAMLTGTVTACVNWSAARVCLPNTA